MAASFFLRYLGKVVIPSNAIESTRSIFRFVVIHEFINI